MYPKARANDILEMACDCFYAPECGASGKSEPELLAEWRCDRKLPSVAMCWLSLDAFG